MKLVDRFLGLCERGQAVLSDRSSFKVVLAGALVGVTPELGCQPTGAEVPLVCQEAYDDCHQNYLNCIYMTPAPDQEKNCKPIQDVCVADASECKQQNASASASNSEGGNSSSHGETDSVQVTEGSTEDAPTSGGGGGGGGGTGEGSTGGETGGNVCPPPDCGENGCLPGQPGAFCDFEINGDVYQGMIDCTGECRLHWEGFWCDDFCDLGPASGTIYNFYCEPFNWDGGACDQAQN